jgi:hypothetical protein
MEALEGRGIAPTQVNLYKAKAVPSPPCRRQGERTHSSYSLLTSTLDGGERLALRLDRGLSPGKDLWYPLERGWVDLRAGLDTEARGKILSLFWESNRSDQLIQHC